MRRLNLMIGMMLIILFITPLSFIVFTIAACTANAAEISSWTDENGVRHYTNQNTPNNAENITTTDEIKHNPAENPRWKKQKETKPNIPKIKKNRYPIRKRNTSATRYSNKKKSKRKISEGIFEVNGYKINVSSHKTGNRLIVSGRVSGGLKCSRLSVRIKITGNNITRGKKHSRYISTSAGDVGYPGSRLLISKNLTVGNKDDLIQWIVDDVDASCK